MNYVNNICLLETDQRYVKFGLIIYYYNNISIKFLLCGKIKSSGKY